MTLDTPWRRPGALRYGLRRLHGILRPPVTVVHADPSMRKDRDVAVPMRDGVVLRVNLYRPPGDGPFPVIVAAHPYGKDAALPRPRRGGWRIPVQFRIMRQPSPVTISSETGWEGPDPDWWTRQGYAVVNADLRGAGRSEGLSSLLSEQEGRDVHDLVEWAGAAPWSTGAAGMLGVSYLAMSQYRGAEQQPPALRAIVPWEGLSDAYRDLFTPGGIPERGFSRIWLAGVRRITRPAIDLGRERTRHPLRDDWWRQLVPDPARIEVPMLVCASFSDDDLHGRGSFRMLERAASVDRHAWTHRGGKWETFYSDEARAAQLAFLDHHLRGVPAARLPRVRLEVRESGERIAEVRDESEWPLARTVWTRLHLGEGGALGAPPSGPGSASFPLRRRGLSFSHRFAAETELTGPMALDLWVSVDGEDADLFVGVEKWRRGRYIPFEGSYGYGRDRIALGWQRMSLRGLDADETTDAQPVHTFDAPEPLGPGEPTRVRIALGPSATLFRAGEELRLVVAGRWIAPRNPLTGQFPARYARGPRGTATLHWGPNRPAALLVPVIPRPREAATAQ